MKYNNYLTTFVAIGLLGSILVPAPAAALSCLSTDEYVKSIIGDEDTLIFTASVDDQIDTTEYTAEVVTVKEAHQGYVDETIFLYHQKDETWGYLCNAGPLEKTGVSAVYIVTRDANGTHTVTQRLLTTDPIAKSLLSSLEAEKIEGGISEITPTDHRNRLMTTISELLQTIARLLQEYQYWK